MLKGTDLRQLVPKWMDQDGSVLIVSFGVFSDAVLGRSRKAGGQQEAEQEEEEEGDEEPEAADEASLGTQAVRARAVMLRCAAGCCDGPTLLSACSVPSAVSCSTQVLVWFSCVPHNLVLHAVPCLRCLLQLSSIAKALCEGPSIVVADEAHNIKNPKSRIHKAMQLINTRCRLALTGYPLQNNLDEYYCMISWVRDAVMMPRARWSTLVGLRSMWHTHARGWYYLLSGRKGRSRTASCVQSHKRERPDTCHVLITCIACRVFGSFWLA